MFDNPLPVILLLMIVWVLSQKLHERSLIRNGLLNAEALAEAKVDVSWMQWVIKKSGDRRWAPQAVVGVCTAAFCILFMLWSALW